jgi:hypothetical protein
VMLSSQTRLMVITGAAASAAAWQNFIPMMGDGGAATRLKGPALYLPTRMDRSGMIIVEMLNAHAHAFSNGRIYGGSYQDELPPHQLAAESLLKAMGLDNTLPLICISVWIFLAMRLH